MKPADCAIHQIVVKTVASTEVPVGSIGHLGYIDEREVCVDWTTPKGQWMECYSARKRSLPFRLAEEGQR